MYTIGEVSKIFNLPISTLRYYDRQGLFPELTRTAGQRMFESRHLEILELIECLKKSGLEIREIKEFIDWTEQGPQTYEQRLKLLEERKEHLKQEMEILKQSEAMIDYKIWYYQTAIQDGNEDRIHQLQQEHSLPEDHQKIYDSLPSHSLKRED